MLLKYFWIYIGSFLAGSIALVFIVKNYVDSFASKSKNPILWGGISATGISGGAFLATFISDYLFVIYWVLTVIYLLFGVIYLVFFHRKYFKSNANNRKRVITGEILFALALLLFTIVVFSALQYFLKNTNFMFFPMLMSTLSFFVPLVLYYTFEAAYKIPDASFSTWYYPVKTPIELPDERPNEKILVIAFEIVKNIKEPGKTNFRAKGPDYMLLGNLYYHFLNDYNEVQSETPIEFTNAKAEPYEWGFRIKSKWFQRNRILDPNLSIKENKVRENSVIVCERILVNDQEI